MNLRLKRSYPKLEDGVRKLDSKGNVIIVFIYVVTGKQEDIDKYGKIMEKEGHTWKDDDGTILWFTTNPVGRSGKLMISPNDKIYADTTQLDLAGAMIKQYPGQLGVMLAREIMGDNVIEPVELPEKKVEPLDR